MLRIGSAFIGESSMDGGDGRFRGCSVGPKNKLSTAWSLKSASLSPVDNL